MNAILYVMLPFVVIVQYVIYDRERTELKSQIMDCAIQCETALNSCTEGDSNGKVHFRIYPTRG